MREQRIIGFIQRLFPFLLWKHTMTSASLRDDAVAGITVALILIPQAIAYAQLAGLPPQYGLYAALLPPVIAALFGSSKYLSTGPVAVISLITASTLAAIPVAEKSELVGYAIMLALLVGGIQIVLGKLKLGVVVNFISHPVIIGFSNAAAIIIATSQLPKVFGVYVDSYEHHYETLYHFVLLAMKEVHLLSIFIALYALLAILAFRKIMPRVPGVLLVVIITTVFSQFIQLEKRETFSVEQIHSVQTISALKTYNSMNNQLNTKTKERIKLLHENEQYKLNNSSSAQIERSLQLQRLHFEIENLKEQIYLYKQQLRTIQFVIQDAKSNKSILLLADQISKEKSSKIWHMKVGDGAIPEKSVVFTSGGSIVGIIPAGLPSIVFPRFSLSILSQFISTAFIIALLGFMESISIGKSLASKNDDKIDPNQELVGQGLANLVGAFTQSYPVSGSFSRSAVNFQAGARSGVASVFTSIFVLITLLFLTPLLYHLPQAVLAVIIILSVIGLVRFDKIIAAWKAHRSDAIIALITFGATLFFAPDLDKGIIIGIILSIGYYVYTRTHPRIAFLSVESSGAFFDAQVAHLPLCKHILVVRFDGSLFFANAAYLENSILAKTADHPRLFKHVILVASGINYIDYTGIEMLENLAKRLREAKKQLSLVNVKSHIAHELVVSGAYAEIGGQHFYKRENDALTSVYDAAHLYMNEKDCPFKAYACLQIGTRRV